MLLSLLFSIVQNHNNPETTIIIKDFKNNRKFRPFIGERRIFTVGFLYLEDKQTKILSFYPEFRKVNLILEVSHKFSTLIITQLCKRKIFGNQHKSLFVKKH